MPISQLHRVAFLVALVGLWSMALSDNAVGQKQKPSPSPPADSSGQGTAPLHCALIVTDLPQPMTPYGFANAALVSLWHARKAQEDAVRGINEAQRETDSLSFQTAMMGSIKI